MDSPESAWRQLFSETALTYFSFSILVTRLQPHPGRPQPPTAPRCGDTRPTPAERRLRPAAQGLWRACSGRPEQAPEQVRPKTGNVAQPKCPHRAPALAPFTPITRGSITAISDNAIGGKRAVHCRPITARPQGPRSPDPRLPRSTCFRNRSGLLKLTGPRTARRPR